MPSPNYITTIKKSSIKRFKYYGVSAKQTGTIYTKLKGNTISDNTKFYDEMNIEEALKYCTDDKATIIFWIVWIILIVAIVYGFYYLDNHWLED